MSTRAIELERERDLGSYLFTAEAIVAFAERYDPQRFHLSDAEAAKTHFGGLCASGWHIAAVWMKLMVRSMAATMREAEAAGAEPFIAGPSPGFRELKWLKPVYAGDTLAYFTKPTHLRPSASRPGWSVLTSQNGARGPSGELVFVFTGTVLIRLPGERET